MTKMRFEDVTRQAEAYSVGWQMRHEGSTREQVADRFRLNGKPEWVEDALWGFDEYDPEDPSNFE